jgi:glycosyltransferase involved in cell wall biosynthesis
LARSIKIFKQKKSSYLPIEINWLKELKIAVNTRLLLKDKLEGIGWFTYESLKRIVLSHPEHEFIFIFDRKFDDEFIIAKNVTPVVVGPPARHPVLFYLWFEHSIPKILKKIKADIFISPDAFCSLKTKVKTLLVIHDLNFEHYPEHLPWLIQKYYRYYTPRFARKATRIATVSEFSKHDIVKQYKIDPEKIDVVYNGANSLFRPLSDLEKEKTKEIFTNGKNYFLFIGAISPRKNLKNLLKGFELYRQNNITDTKLLVVGEKMWDGGGLDAVFSKMKFKDEVSFTGRLKPEELAEVIGSALALTYTSFFEGFGIPIIEAFNAGTPVITSNTTSMPEIAGDAALLADPFKPESIANAMKDITFNVRLRNKLVEKGNVRKLDFSWEKTANNLWKSIEKVIKQNSQNA